MKKEMILVVFGILFLSLGINLITSFESFTLNSTSNLIKNTSVNGKIYTLELVSASTTSAIISIKSPNGIIEQKEITEGSTKIVNGLKVFIISADSNNMYYGASLKVDSVFDVNNDGKITPLDCLIIINYLNKYGFGQSNNINNTTDYLDVSGDGRITPLDALLTINKINSL